MDWVFLTVGLFYLIPFLALFRYYTIIKTREYLLASLVFLILAFNGISIGFLGLGNIPETLSIMIAIFLLVFVTKRTLSYRYNLFFYTILLFMTFFSIGNIILFFQDSYLNTWRIIVFEMIRFLLGIYLTISYYKIDLVQTTSRTNTVKYSWMISGIIAIITSIIRIVDVFQYVLQTQTNAIHPSAPELTASLNIISGGALLLSLITGIVAVLFPELFLLSRIQIDNLYELYELSELMNRNNDVTLLPNFSLLEYLQVIQDTKDE